jgi:hypothetical protein
MPRLYERTGFMARRVLYPRERPTVSDSRLDSCATLLDERTGSSINRVSFGLEVS